ncbi:hypothetical protein ACH4S8_38025 [Streptomyces sp. NPDC021080]|uniref:hypothetical protein n=1 Tax=Streptomyces sp. NPDC021080 TaxID=3365110 RepID=UPI0037949074
MTVLPLPFKQLRDADPGFRLDPDGRASFLVDDYRVDVHVRYTTEDDRADYSATGEHPEVLVSASVAVAYVVVGRAWMLSEWINPYSLRDAVAFVIREAVEGAERKVDDMAAEVAENRAKRKKEARK